MVHVDSLVTGGGTCDKKMEMEAMKSSEIVGNETGGEVIMGARVYLVSIGPISEMLEDDGSEEAVPVLEAGLRPEKPATNRNLKLRLSVGLTPNGIVGPGW